VNSSTIAAAELPLALRMLMAITRRIPPLPYASALSNRLVKPLWCRRHRDRYVLPVWDGIVMRVDPADAIGGYLTFIPQLYDRWERQMIRDYLPRGGSFVDVGANIGAHSLWAATVGGAAARVLAFEADPTNFAELTSNIALNHLSNIRAFHVGVSDADAVLKLFRNRHGNAGGHTFVAAIHDDPAAVDVRCRPLRDLLVETGTAHVDLMKLDIEGFERRVLTRFFADILPASPLRPKHLLIELTSGTEREALVELLAQEGYVLVKQHGINSLFSRRAEKA
jgi:FkbM family methyltransferase